MRMIFKGILLPLNSTVEPFAFALGTIHRSNSN